MNTVTVARHQDISCVIVTRFAAVRSMLDDAKNESERLKAKQPSDITSPNQISQHQLVNREPSDIAGSDDANIAYCADGRCDPEDPEEFCDKDDNNADIVDTRSDDEEETYCGLKCTHTGSHKACQLKDHETKLDPGK